MYKKTKSNDERKAEIEQILKDMEEGIKNVFKSDRYIEFLKFISKFHNYSPNNLVWLQNQRENITRVAGIKTWNKLGRKINKGEKALKVLAPIMRSKEIKKEKVDPINGQAIENIEKIEWITYRAVPVFDISQTNGKELPTLIDELKGNLEHINILKNSIEKVSKVPINFENIQNGAKGYYSPIENKIAIKQDMSDIQTLKTMIHELAHSRLHNLEKQTEENLDRNKKELEAESVAYVVLNHFNVDTSDYSFGYLASWSKDKELNDLKDCLKTIQKESDNLIVEIENEIQKHLEIQKENLNIEKNNIDERQINKDGIFKEPYILINYSECSCFNKNQILEFKEANEIFKEVENKVQVLKEEYESKGEYYPELKTKFELHYSKDKHITLRCDLGDKYANNLKEFINKELGNSNKYKNIIESINNIEKKSVRNKLKTIKENRLSKISQNKNAQKETERI